MSLFDEPTASSRPRSAARRPPRTKPEPMPSWLARKLESEGHLDFSQGGPVATRRARAIICPDCHRFVMRGLLALPTPWAIDVDPEPLTAEGEALALLAGLSTYRLRWVGDRYEIDRRDMSRIGFKPVTYNQGFDVLVEHRHGENAGDRYPTQRSQVPEPRDEHQLGPDEPPF